VAVKSVASYCVVPLDAVVGTVVNVAVNDAAMVAPLEPVMPETVTVKVVFEARAAAGVKVAVFVVAL
jgi:hypothetical protein